MVDQYPFLIVVEFFKTNVGFASIEKQLAKVVKVAKSCI